MSWRWWAAMFGFCAAAAGACSGKSDRDEADPIDGSGGADGGSGGTSPAHAGEQGDDGSSVTSSGGAPTLTATGASSTATTRGTTLGTTSSATGTTAVTSAGGTATVPMAPAGWNCLPSAYDDGAECHCGCGIVDPDCDDSSADSCDVCVFDGSCAGGNCPSSIDEDDNSRCDVPEGWTCLDSLYANGVCHCGCGIVDVDCSSASSDACEVCWTGCTGEGCPGRIDADNNAICTGVSPNWTCSDRFFGDGLLCHCGCGALDPDCSANDLAECDRCDFEGSCSAGECPGTIDPENITRCERPNPPQEWSCYAGYYADGAICHCGCGALDLDCPQDSIDSCQNCEACGSGACSIKIDPDDIASCLPPPDDWTCAEYEYADDYACHCGCGVLDPDCESLDASSCEACSAHNGSCADDYDCAGIDPEDNTRCVDSAPPEWNCDPEAFGDHACDCGCGARDLDCASGDPGVCEFCDLEGSCSDTGCSDLNADDNAVCVTEAP